MKIEIFIKKLERMKSHLSNYDSEADIKLNSISFEKGDRPAITLCIANENNYIERSIRYRFTEGDDGIEEIVL